MTFKDFVETLTLGQGEIVYNSIMSQYPNIRLAHLIDFKNLIWEEMAIDWRKALIKALNLSKIGYKGMIKSLEDDIAFLEEFKTKIKDMNKKSGTNDSLVKNQVLFKDWERLKMCLYVKTDDLNSWKEEDFNNFAVYWEAIVIQSKEGIVYHSKNISIIDSLVENIKEVNNEKKI